MQSCLFRVNFCSVPSCFRANDWRILTYKTHSRGWPKQEVEPSKQTMGDQAETTAKAPKVAIVGAGLTGLLAAQGLKRVPQFFSESILTNILDG